MTSDNLAKKSELASLNNDLIVKSSKVASANSNKKLACIREGIPEELQTFLSTFEIDGEFMSLEAYGSGHLHRTMRGEWQCGSKKVWYIHQCLNTSIFKDVSALMNNIETATSHLRKKLIELESNNLVVLSIVHTQGGASYAQAIDGSCWRTYEFVTDTESYDCCLDIDHAREAALTFGHFNSLLSDLDPSLFHAVIPDFIDTPKRFISFRNAVERDPEGRVEAVQKEIDFAFAHEAEAGMIMEGLRSGTFPWRITHNDMKLNNLLFCRHTGRGKCVVDLDTVMPGSNLYDFGDLVRTASVQAPEDEKELSKVEMNIEYFKALLQGFLHGIGDGLNRD
ncbi:MAG: aminoglycoside phosphotransferase family protein, partial [SAR324 cluster bacterium]|nr:aminoglycoside phosphotransferase family protein [SAR324 cluster bacterium]